MIRCTACGRHISTRYFEQFDENTAEGVCTCPHCLTQQQFVIEAFHSWCRHCGSEKFYISEEHTMESRRTVSEIWRGDFGDDVVLYQVNSTNFTTYHKNCEECFETDRILIIPVGSSLSIHPEDIPSGYSKIF